MRAHDVDIVTGCAVPRRYFGTEIGICVVNDAERTLVASIDKEVVDGRVVSEKTHNASKACFVFVCPGVDAACQDANSIFEVWCGRTLSEE